MNGPKYEMIPCPLFSSFICKRKGSVQENVEFKKYKRYFIKVFIILGEILTKQTKCPFTAHLILSALHCSSPGLWAVVGVWPELLTVATPCLGRCCCCCWAEL